MPAIEPQTGRISKLYSWTDSDVECIKRLRARYGFVSDTETIRRILRWVDETKPEMAIRPIPETPQKKTKRGA